MIDHADLPLPTGFTLRRGSGEAPRPSARAAAALQYSHARLERSIAVFGRIGRGIPAAVIIVASIGLVTWCMAGNAIWSAHRPPLSLYLIPLVFTAAVFGYRAGMLATLVVSGISLWMLIVDQSHLPHAPTAISAVNVASFLLPCSIMVFVIARLREALISLERLHDDLVIADSQVIDSEERRIHFNRDVLLAVTNGRLLLCDDEEIARSLHGERILRLEIKEPRDISLIRQAARNALTERRRLTSRLYDFEACATEAATNALKYGKNGYFEL